MEKRLYHGSVTPGIVALEPRSRLHGTEQQVVYLTDCAPYALFYIWDEQKHGGAGKHVTAWIKDGIAHYEEQFPDQLQAFYQGVSGWLYTAEESCRAQLMPGRQNLYYVPGMVKVCAAEFVPDVYERLLEYEQAGMLAVRRFREQTRERQAELTAMMTTAVVRSGFFAGDPVQRAFMRKYFMQAWQQAVQDNIRVQAVEPGSALWDRLTAFADGCSWIAGKHLAEMMRGNRFHAWERVFAAVCGGEIVGYCTFLETDYYPENRYWPWISSIFVDEMFRGCRISRQMIDTVIDYAKEQGFGRVYIPSDMTGFYEQYGFEKIDELTNYGGDVDGIFAKNI